jgi:DNA topoisomerase-2
MHLYSPKGSIKKYDTVYDIIDDYYNVRLELYQKRKDYQLDVLKNQLEMISYKVKFILLVIDKKINVNNRKKSEIETDLESHDFPRIKNNFDYLLSMPIYNLTFEKVEELKKQKQDKETEYNELKEKTINIMWMEELEKLEQVLDVFEEQRESERSDSKPVKTKKIKK